MPFSIRQHAPDRTFCESLTMDALSRVIPPAAIDHALAFHACQAARIRKLSLPMVIWILIAMNLFTTSAIPDVIRKVTQGLRLFWHDPDYRLPGAAALVYRRAQIGLGPLITLFRQICHPLATPATPGAFAFGLRLMALDGTTEDVADTPDNARVFGRPGTTAGPAAFPQLRAVYLIECGTHAIVDAAFTPYDTHERVSGTRLLRSITDGMLVLWDRGFHSYAMINAVWGQGAHVLGRLPANITVVRGPTLSDGSYRAVLRPAHEQRTFPQAWLRVRIIEYTIRDPALGTPRERYRLITTLLDHHDAPALALACTYHERWEIELVIDELDTHQRVAGRPFRSRTPLGVYQEAYALLLAHYVIRVLIHEAASTVGLDPDRLSFVHALRLLQEAVLEFQLVAPTDHDRLAARLVRAVAQGRLPERALRSNPRVLKRTASPFRRKCPEDRNPPRAHVRTFHQAVVISDGPTTAGPAWHANWWHLREIDGGWTAGV